MQNKRNPEISIIVPVYDVEPYIRRCLDSIRAQTFSDFEVLVIDDSSPDGSVKIAEEFVEKDSRFRIITRPNGGLSAARNTGIKNASGKYIAFIDSDDFIDSTYLEKLYNACEENGADMSYCGFTYYMHNSGIKKKQMAIVKTCVMEHDEAVSRLISDHGLHSYAWNKLYRRRLFTEHNIRYPTMYFEDIATSTRAVFYANKLAVVGECLYYYVKRPGSILSTMNIKKMNDLLYSVMIICNFLRRHKEYEKFEGEIKRITTKFKYMNIYSIIRHHLFSLSFRGTKEDLKTNFQMAKYILSCDWKVMDYFPELPYEIKQHDFREP